MLVALFVPMKIRETVATQIHRDTSAMRIAMVTPSTSTAVDRSAVTPAADRRATTACSATAWSAVRIRTTHGWACGQGMATTGVTTVVDMAVTAATVVAVEACAWASGAVVVGGDDRLCAGIADASTTRGSVTRSSIAIAGQRCPAVQLYVPRTTPR